MKDSSDPDPVVYQTNAYTTNLCVAFSRFLPNTFIKVFSEKSCQLSTNEHLLLMKLSIFIVAACRTEFRNIFSNSRFPFGSIIRTMMQKMAFIHK